MVMLVGLLNNFWILFRNMYFLKVNKKSPQLSENPEPKKFSFFSLSSLELLLATKKLEGDFHCKSLWGEKKKKENIDFA